MKPTETIQLFDAFLLARELSLEAVVVGGTALALLGVISRQTRDCDVIYPELPDEIRRAARAFAAERRAANNYIADDWLALAPSSDELEEIRPWLEQRDGNPDWPSHVRETLSEIERSLSDGV